MKKFIALLLFTALGAQLVNQTNTFHEATTTSIKKVASVSPTEFKPVEAQQIAISSSYKAPVTVVAPKPVTYKPTGTHAEWMTAAGIPESDWQYVEYIVSHESGWKPCAYYPSQNDCSANPVNACGLVMQNPCHKIGGDWRDPIAALRWQKSYVSRYGGYAGAYNYWLIHKNY